ncbi:MAG: T9SS type A sorting domain-containing protein [Bacteroidetes bacterium]|nr:T9SS type A sorting domain-containing protein [Bacteroidota bacterium]
MKKTILSTICGVFITVTASAQIPNGGFESWTLVGGAYQNPNNWDNLNAFTNAMGVYTCTMGTPGNPGHAYLKLTSKTVSGMGVVPGIATTGTINTTTLKVSGGFPFTQRPQSLMGNWQYMPFGSNDTSMVAVYLTQWNSTSNTRDTVAFAVQNLTGMVMSWAAFTINLTYKNGNNPDTAQIILASSKSTPSANSYLYIDNLSFAGSVSGIKTNNPSTVKVRIFPNPATDKVVLTAHESVFSDTKIELFDILGKQVKSYTHKNINQDYTIPVSDLEKGMYFIQVTAGNDVFIHKMYKQ